MFINLFVAITGTLQVYVFFFDSRNDIDQRFSNLAIMGVSLEASLKLINSILKKEKIKKLIREFTEIYFTLENHEKKGFETQTEWFRKSSLVLAITHVTTLAMFSIIPVLLMVHQHILKGEFKLLRPYNSWWPFKSEGKLFFFTYFCQIYIAAIGSFNSIGIDIMISGVISNITLLYKILNFRLKKFVTTKNFSRDEIVNFVDFSIKISKKCDELDQTMGITVLARVFIASMIISVTVMIFMTQDDVIMVAKFCGILLMNLIATFKICHFGNQVENEVCRIKI